MSNQTEKELLLNLHEKVDDLRERVHSIDIVLVKNTASLEEHMRRTKVVEEEHDFFEQEVKPALNAYKFVAFLFKFIAPVITGVGVYIKYFN